jgi:hypothetical protein
VAAYLASLAILLAAVPIPPAAAQDPVADAPDTATQDSAAPGGSAAPLAVAHSPVGCMVAGTNPQIDAGITPDGQVQAGRVYFHSALSDAFYYVEMNVEGGRYVGVLPKPRPDAGPITYYVEGVGTNYAQTQSPEAQATVVEKAEDCRDKPVAALGPADPVRVFSVAGGTALPAGFTGVSSVVAAGAGAGAAAAATAAGGGMSGGTIAIIGGAIAVGVGTIAIVTTGSPPASPSR